MQSLFLIRQFSCGFHPLRIDTDEFGDIVSDQRSFQFPSLDIQDGLHPDEVQ